MTVLDVAIVGAGPAGLAAATLCAAHGLSTAVYDEQDAPGGQVYRGITASPLARPEILGDDYWGGAGLILPFARSGARYVRGANVWSVARCDDGAFALGITHGPPAARTTISVVARAVILAAGALERPFPIPGWTLPGVLTAGAAQILLKTAGVVPRGQTVLAGCGPLLWLLAWQYLRAGVAVAALLDTTPHGRLAQALRHAPGFMMSPYFAKGRDLVRAVRRKVRVVEYVESLAIEGSDAATAVRYRTRDADESLPVDQVLLHQGVVPDVNLAGAAGCALEWRELQACFAPAVDAWGGTTVPGLFVAGDGAGIAGADAAPALGRLAALAVANALGRIDADARQRLARPQRNLLAHALRGRTFLDTLYRPAAAFRIPAGATIACRCEEVSAATIAQLARDGCAGPNQMKAYTRCGMGPCQGRQCGLTVTEIIAAEQRRTPADVGHYRSRFPVKPVTLADLAAMPVTPEAREAVEHPPAASPTPR
jgi:NADPH-dependent 2,4-dienoyl-CoA reductase/sulfur reductase-like enzyme